VKYRSYGLHFVVSRAGPIAGASSEQSFDSLCQLLALWIDKTAVAADQAALSVDQLFMKVPAGAVSGGPRQRLVQRICIFTFHPGLGVLGKLHAISQPAEILVRFISGLQIGREL
jgi:hypothetical protein